MKIKVAYNLFQEFSFLRDVLRTYGRYMGCGQYRLLPCMRVLVLDAPEVLSCADVYFSNKAAQPKFQPFIAGVNRIRWFYNEKGIGSYSAIYVANNNDKCSEIKLFSFEKRKSLQFAHLSKKNSISSGSTRNIPMVTPCHALVQVI